MFQQVLNRSQYFLPIISMFPGSFFQAVDQLIKFFQYEDSVHPSQTAKGFPARKNHIHRMGVTDAKRWLSRRIYGWITRRDVLPAL